MESIVTHKMTVLRAILLLGLGIGAASARAASPTIMRVFPENIQGDTIYLRAGEDVTFEVAGYDTDGNLRGSEWYRSGVFQSPASLISATDSATFIKTFSFASVGTFIITARVFDLDYNYDSTPVKWNVKVVDEPKTMYASLGSVAGVAAAEDSLISYALENNIKTIFAYGTNQLVKTKYPSDKARLSAFILKAKTAGIEKVLMVAGRGQNLSLLDSVYSYHSDPAYEDIDGIIMEFEYWNDHAYNFCDDRAECFDSTLAYFEHASTLFGSPGNSDFKVGIYLGNGEPEWGDRYDEWLIEAGYLQDLTDFALHHYYTPKTGSDIYLDGKIARLQAFLDAAPPAHEFELMPLFSLEYEGYYPHNNSGLNDIDSLEQWWFDAFAADNLTNKYQAKLTRPSYFLYSYMDDDHIYPPLQMNFRRTYNGNTNGKDTTYIALGDTVVFLSRVDDYKSGSSSDAEDRYPVDEEADLMGAVWYINDQLYDSTLVPVPTSVTANVQNRYEFQQEVVFDSDSVDTYKITMTTYDSGYHYSPRVIEKWVVIEASPGSRLNNEDKPQGATGFLNVYPNPTHDGKVKVQIDGEYQGRGWVHLYSIAGELLQEKEIELSSQEFELDMSMLPPGSYVLKASDGFRQVERHLIKQ